MPGSDRASPSFPQKPQFPQRGKMRAFILSSQYPSECCPFLKNFSYICRVMRLSRLALHIVKVFFASPYMKMWKFSRLVGRYGTTLTSCRFMRIGAFCTLIPHIYYGVGYCVVYFRLGLTTTFSRMNESQLHTFFVCG